jgi:hypothetical protein
MGFLEGDLIADRDLFGRFCRPKCRRFRRCVSCSRLDP